MIGDDNLKKILILAKSLGGGGSEVALIELLNAIDITQYKISLILLDKDEEYINRLNREINTIFINFKKPIYHKLVSMYSISGKVLKKLCINKYVPFYEWLFNKITNDFSDVYDIAIDFYGYGYFLTGLLANKVKAKRKATWLHDESIPWTNNIEKYYDKIDQICCVSKAVRNAFILKYPQEAKKALVVYNVIDVNRVKNLSMQSVADNFDDTFKIVTVGRLHWQKGYDIAIKSARILKDKGLEFKWYVIGNGNEKRKLKKLVKKNSLEGEFIFLGSRQNPYPYMKKCDLYVQPSRHEGYVITLVEARILGIPILSSNIESAKEQIINGKNGYLVSLNPEDLSQKIKYLYEHRDALALVSNNLKQENINFEMELEKIYNL